MPRGEVVAITGCGVVTPLGHDPDTLFDALCAQRSAIAPLPPPLAQRLTSPVAARVVDFDPAAHFDPPRLRLLDRATQFALVAAQAALRAAGIELARCDRHRCGVAVGTGMAGAQSSDDGFRSLYGEHDERVKPYSVLLAMNHAAAAWIGIDHGLRGPSLTISTACSSSAVAIGEAARRVAAGEVDLMLAGGTEAPLALGSLKAWEALRTLAPMAADPATSCRPFALDRAGMVLAEGAAFVVLERAAHAQARGATPLARLAGYGLTTDVEHITRPSVAGQAAAMQAALDDAQLAPSAIDYLNAHGTGTQANDAVETAAIRQVFGAHARDLAVSSTKSMHGHLLGAGGALEFVIALQALRRRTAPPTAHLRVPDPACDLDYVASGPRPLRAGGGAVMSSSFAFGGTNAVLIASAA